MDSLTQHNIYKRLLHYNDFFDKMNLEDKRTVLSSLYEEVHLHTKEAWEDGKKTIKSIKYTFPISGAIMQKLGEISIDVETEILLLFKMRIRIMKNWFTIDQIDDDTHIISEYRHWEETHCYLLEGKDRCLLIDTGLGICNISREVENLTDKPIIAVATHIHWDHIGGHKYYPDFYVHEAELNWLNGDFPLSIDTIRDMVIERCDLPKGYDVNGYEFFQGTPTRVLSDRDVIDLGGRIIKILHTPGHSPGHICFWEEEHLITVIGRCGCKIIRFQ